MHSLSEVFNEVAKFFIESLDWLRRSREYGISEKTNLLNRHSPILTESLTQALQLKRI